MLRQLLEGSRFLSYAYSYPHKTAYRPLTPPIALQDLWQDEDKRALFLYLHIPFCEMRCGFCNLFTLANPKDDLTQLYIQALTKQISVVRESLQGAQFARMAIGGGTPTFLDESSLITLFALVTEQLGISMHEIPISCEMSPATATSEKLALLQQAGIDRVSIGIQSFLEAETRAFGRPQTPEQATRALEQIRACDFSTLNIDLIYGASNQTESSWLHSLHTTLQFNPEEIYLYPLYVRPLTGLGNQKRSWDDHRLALYRAGRDFLLAHGYRQISMRMFQRQDARTIGGPVYVCQQDGMVGLGVGARSYTHALHYCTEYAVGRNGVKEILQDYIARDAAQFGFADYGIWLDDEDQRRRFVILSLLSHEGLHHAMYRDRFGTAPTDDFPALLELLELGLATQQDDVLALTSEGLECSDLIGPWLVSDKVRTRTKEYNLR